MKRLTLIAAMIVTITHSGSAMDPHHLQMLLEQDLTNQELTQRADAAVDRGDYKTAYRQLTTLAKRGDQWAQMMIAAMLSEGTYEGVPQDYARGAFWYSKSAEQGNVDAQIALGVKYYYGQGVPQDYANAAKWWRKAAERGNADAQFNLGLLYADGQGVPKDYTKAVKWYRKAADQGVAVAQNNLGVLYRDGKGILQDHLFAFVWFNIAAAMGDKWAPNHRDNVAKKLNKAELEKARAISKLCWRKPANCPR